jgi:hypothetical protein
MAIFNFPIQSEDHTKHAVRAARKILKRWRVERETLAERFGLAAANLA